MQPYIVLVQSACTVDSFTVAHMHCVVSGRQTLKHCNNLHYNIVYGIEINYYLSFPWQWAC